MLQPTFVRRSAVTTAVAAAVRHSGTGPHCAVHNSNPYFTLRPRAPSAANLQPRKLQEQHQKVHQHTLSEVLPTPSEACLREFKHFYETVTRSPEATSLPPTPLGHGGSERIFNNELLHQSPWQASCVELRERAVGEAELLSYDSIDFTGLRRQHRVTAGQQQQQSPCASYSNVEDMRPKGGPQRGPGLDVVHYYETSSPAGLARYQRVAMQVQKSLLPGSCTNFSAEGGFAAWVVPQDEYAQAMAAMGFLTK